MKASGTTAPKIAIVCPVGHFDRHGYQHVIRTCILSMAAFASRVILVQSVRSGQSLADILQAPVANVTLVSDERTWFEMREGAEYFDLNKIGANVNLGLEIAREDGFEVAIHAESNQYVPKATRKPLKATCAALLEGGYPYGWLYRRDQLADTTFHANLRRPWIFNLAMGVSVGEPDGAILDGHFIQHERGNWPARDGEALVDCPLEMSLADLSEKMAFFRSLVEWAPKRPAAFEWNYWRTYSVNKFRAKEKDGAALDIYGEAIAAISAGHPEFLSHEVLGLL